MRIPDKIERALFIQIKQAGDCLLSTPALRAFKKRFPGSRLDYLAGRYSAGILYNNPHIDNLIVIDDNGWRQMLSLMFSLRKRKYDLAVDFLSSPTSSKMTFVTGAGIRIGYSRRGRRWAYNSFPDTTNPDDYSARDKLRLVEPLGVEQNGLRLDFVLPENEIKVALKDLGHRPNGLLAVVPVSRRPYKRWPERNFARLLDRACRELNLKPLLLCGPGEMGLIENVAREMENQPIMREMSSFQQFGAYLSLSKMYIGNDNGPKHIAVALGKPTVTIAGHINPLNWTEPANPGHIVVQRKLDCQMGCNPKKCKNPRCITEISVDEAFTKFKEHWNRFAGG